MRNAWPALVERVSKCRLRVLPVLHSLRGRCDLAQIRTTIRFMRCYYANLNFPNNSPEATLLFLLIHIEAVPDEEERGPHISRAKSRANHQEALALHQRERAHHVLDTEAIVPAAARKGYPPADGKCAMPCRVLTRCLWRPSSSGRKKCNSLNFKELPIQRPYLRGTGDRGGTMMEVTWAMKLRRGGAVLSQREKRMFPFGDECAAGKALWLCTVDRRGRCELALDVPLYFFPAIVDSPAHGLSSPSWNNSPRKIRPATGTPTTGTAYAP